MSQENLPPATIQRHAVRALLYATDSQRLLLIHTFIPDSGKLIWLAPGGGMEAAETPHQCLLREIKEETGFCAQHSTPQGPVWYRQQQFALREQQFDQYEEFFWVPVTQFTPDSTNNPAQDEKDIFRGFRWWSLAEIVEAGRTRSGDIFVPLTLGRHLTRLLNEGLPAQAVDVGL